MQEYKDLTPSDFEFVQLDDTIYDTRFETKPVGYLKDAWNRFKKNKASVVAAIIILILFLIFRNKKKKDKSEDEVEMNADP